jgi:hypothetical protein
VRWLVNELRDVLGDPPPTPVSFRVRVWCGEKSDGGCGPFGWVLVARRVPQFALRRVLRHLYRRSWDEPSILVERR